MLTNSKYHQNQEQLLHENVIVEAAKSNPNEFEPIYKKYFQQIHRYVSNRITDSDEAQDITQQIFVKAITRLHQYQFMGVPFSSWLYRIAMSEVYQHLKDQKTGHIKFDKVSYLNLCEENDLDEQEFEKTRQQISLLISKLDQQDMQIIEMRYFENKSFREIGQFLDMTENYAKVRSFRIINKLRRMYEKTFA